VAALPLSMCTRTLAGLALEGSHVYSPVSEGIAFWMRRRLVVTGPFSVTRLMPPRGESKLITWQQSETLLCLNTVVSPNSSYRTGTENTRTTVHYTALTHLWRHVTYIERSGATATLLPLQFTGCHRIRCPTQCDHYWSIVFPHLSSNHSWLTHQSHLAIKSRGTVAKQGWQNSWFS
jgi:hypothetical protein